MQAHSLYEVLGVEPKASTETIKSAYRELAKRYHPDAHPDHPEYEEVLKEITAAYAVLGNPIKRAAYELQLASGNDTGATEPEDMWEPSPEELRNIYALDEDARVKEIDRLCEMHPHLRQFFEDRPPPPRFKPTDAYVAEFRMRDRVWREREAERQCARHPHLREWFAALNAGCDRADEEHARELARQRAREQRYQEERALWSGVAASSLGAAGALFAAFFPCWIIGTVVFLFSGGALGGSDARFQATLLEQSWFWRLWILCGLAGAGLGFAAQLKSEWLLSETRQVVQVRWKGGSIAALSLVASATMIYLAASNDAHEIEWHKGRPRAVQVQAAPSTVARRVTIDGTTVWPSTETNPVAPIRVGQNPTIAVEYGGLVSGDQLEVWLVQRYTPTATGGQVKGRCTSERLAPTGTWSCRWTTFIPPGNYQFSLYLKTTQLVSLGNYVFTMGY